MNEWLLKRYLKMMSGDRIGLLILIAILTGGVLTLAATAKLIILLLG